MGCACTGLSSYDSVTLCNDSELGICCSSVSHCHTGCITYMSYMCSTVHTRLLKTVLRYLILAILSHTNCTSFTYFTCHSTIALHADRLQTGVHHCLGKHVSR
jgi:hypothetical protein